MDEGFGRNPMQDFLRHLDRGNPEHRTLLFIVEELGEVKQADADGFSSVGDSLKAILAALKPAPAAPPTGIWTLNYRGAKFSGGSPMGSSIQEGFGVDGTFQPTDALGEPDMQATVAFSSDNPAVVTVVDAATGAAPFAFSADITAGATAGQTANVVAMVQDPDGSAPVPVSYAIIVLAGDATGGTFAVGAQRPTPAAPPAA